MYAHTHDFCSEAGNALYLQALEPRKLYKRTLRRCTSGDNGIKANPFELPNFIIFIQDFQFDQLNLTFKQFEIKLSI